MTQNQDRDFKKNRAYSYPKSFENPITKLGDCCKNVKKKKSFKITTENNLELNIVWGRRKTQSMISAL